jgi:hypothetical protein
VNVFGSGLGLYNSKGVLIGGVGVSGDTSRADHNIAWRTRHQLNLDFVPAGVSAKGDDNINYKGLVPVPSLRIGSVAAEHIVIVSTAIELVGAGFADQDVGSHSAICNVIAHAADDCVALGVRCARCPIQCANPGLHVPGVFF